MEMPALFFWDQFVKNYILFYSVLYRNVLPQYSFACSCIIMCVSACILCVCGMLVFLFCMKIPVVFQGPVRGRQQSVLRVAVSQSTALLQFRLFMHEHVCERMHIMIVMFVLLFISMKIPVLFCRDQFVEDNAVLYCNVLLCYGFASECMH